MRLTRNSSLSYSNRMLADTTPLGGSLIATHDPQWAAQFNAHPEWTARGQQIGEENPCGEWVWKGFYDYSRFEDSAMACGTNDECIYQVAFAEGAPSHIAYRTHALHGQGNDEFLQGTLREIPLLTGFVAKNPFFGVAEAFFIDQQAGLLEDFERLGVLQDALLDGTPVELQAGPKSYACAGGFRFRNPASKYYVDPADPQAASKLASLQTRMDAIRTLVTRNAGYLLNPTAAQKLVFPNAERFDNE